MSPRHLFVFVTTIAAALGMATVIAMPPSFMSQSIGQEPVQRWRSSDSKSGWLKQLNLSAEQMQQIQAIRQRDESKRSDRRRVIKQARQELRDLMAGNASLADVRQKFTQLRSLKQEAADTQFETMLAIREVLAPTQRQKFADLMQQRDKFAPRSDAAKDAP